MGITRCLQSLVEKCKVKFVVLQTNAINLHGIINRGSPKLSLDVLARFFLFCLDCKITIAIEWVPAREENVLAHDISKWLIPDDSSLSRQFFDMLNHRWGPHTCDLFSSNDNNRCFKFDSVHWCRGKPSVICLGFDWGVDNCWVYPPLF